VLHDPPRLLRIALKRLVDQLRREKVPAHSDGQAADGEKNAQTRDTVGLARRKPYFGPIVNRFEPSLKANVLPLTLRPSRLAQAPTLVLLPKLPDFLRLYRDTVGCTVFCGIRRTEDSRQAGRRRHSGAGAANAAIRGPISWNCRAGHRDQRKHPAVDRPCAHVRRRYAARMRRPAPVPTLFGRGCANTSPCTPPNRVTALCCHRGKLTIAAAGDGRRGGGWVARRSFTSRPDWRAFRAVLTGLRVQCPAAMPVVIRTSWLPDTILGQCIRRQERFVVRLNHRMGEEQAVECLLHEWAHALAWNYSLDRLAGVPGLDPVEFERASHDEVWGCAYSRVWRAYLEVGEAGG
jgi:hypothetical protein